MAGVAAVAGLDGGAVGGWIVVAGGTRETGGGIDARVVVVVVGATVVVVVVGARVVVDVVGAVVVVVVVGARVVVVVVVEVVVVEVVVVASCGQSTRVVVIVDFTVASGMSSTPVTQAVFENSIVDPSDGQGGTSYSMTKCFWTVGPTKKRSHGKVTHGTPELIR